jgi:bifunctional aspartokinase / homoserine dehydrogenase 1
VTRSGPQVFKFGGVAVGSVEAVRAAAEHVRRAAPNVAVVVSAMNGVTDLLHDAATAALRGDRSAFDTAARAFEQRHLALINDLFTAKRQSQDLRDVLTESTRELMAMAESIAVLRELTPRALDALVARGERVLARIFTEFLNHSGVAAEFVDAADIIITERRLGSVWPSLTKCERAATKLIQPALEAGRVVIMPGYLGRGPDGEVVTLGRGGSDFSAAILARSLDARSLTLWKEVDGLMTADPRRVPRARLLGELHYREAGELAFYGAKVLHPRS